MYEIVEPYFDRYGSGAVWDHARTLPPPADPDALGTPEEREKFLDALAYKAQTYRHKWNMGDDAPKDLENEMERLLGVRRFAPKKKPCQADIAALR